MTYQDTINYLYTAAPLFQQKGAAAYKPGLHTTHLLDEHFGYPHRKFKSIHIAGTNGKGSTAHTIAAILQSAGYKVGLYTSPHLVDFRERIRINGEMVSEQYVIDFVENERNFFEPLSPSFFELTTALAFKYFAEKQVDVAIIEVGLGGRLDCTNIITPLLSIITNISLDHTQFLGHSLKEIASEKAGIIKANVPVVIGEYTDETKAVFFEKASLEDSPIFFAEDNMEVLHAEVLPNGFRRYTTKSFGVLDSELSADYQVANANTILTAIRILMQQDDFQQLSKTHILKGVKDTCKLTGLQGRWQKLQDNPLLICDTGHNTGAWALLQKELMQLNKEHLHIIFGVANDKDIAHILDFLPKEATYYWTRASVDRALNEKELASQARARNLNGDTYATVKEAFEAAYKNSKPKDAIFIGGSNFIVADFLTNNISKVDRL